MFFKAMSKCVWLGSGEAPLDLRQARQADSPLQKKPDEEVNLMNIYSGQDMSPHSAGRLIVSSDVCGNHQKGDKKKERLRSSHRALLPAKTANSKKDGLKRSFTAPLQQIEQNIRELDQCG